MVWMPKPMPTPFYNELAADAKAKICDADAAARLEMGGTADEWIKRRCKAK
jgi:hypothetical protein